MFEQITFTVEGTPVTQGSKQTFVPTYGEGNVVRRHKADCPGRLVHGPYSNEHGADLCRCPIMANTVEDNKNLGPWREAVGWAGRMAYKGELLDCLLTMSLVFIRPRPKAHYGTGRNERVLKDRAPAAPGSKPDAGKLARAVEDALTNVIYTDDALLVDTYHSKRYCHRWEPERVIVTIRPALAQTVGDMVAHDMLELPRVEDEYEQMSLAVA